MIKLIIFDFDGVIITGSHEGYFNCYHKTLKSVGVKLGTQEEKRRIHELWGKPIKDVLEGLLKEHLDLLEKALAAYDKYYYSPVFTKNLKLVPGAKVLLENLSRNYILGIASGMRRNTMDELIKRFEINYFKKIVTNEDIVDYEDSKPAPFMINKILSDLKVSKKEAIMVGDAGNDIEMARNAGVTPVVVLSGHLSKKDAEDLDVKYIIPDITHLPKLLKTIP